MYMESPIAINMYEIVFESISRRFKHNHNEPFNTATKTATGTWLSIVNHATAWRREL